MASFGRLKVAEQNGGTEDSDDIRDGGTDETNAMNAVKQYAARYRTNNITDDITAELTSISQSYDALE